MKLYAITDAARLAADWSGREAALVALAGQWAAGGVDFIQIREKNLAAGALERLSHRVMEAVKAAGTHTAVLINGRADVALAVGADGVHLSGVSGTTAPMLRRLFAASGSRKALVSVACHSLQDVEKARDEGADIALFSPIFCKIQPDGSLTPGVGLDALKRACEAAGAMQVCALGGVTVENAEACRAAGAAGIAAIRLFQGADWRALK
jgi:thiamine-phosphate pyrophosphorylase